MEMPFWETKMRAKQLMQYYEEKGKAMENMASKIKKPSSSSLHVPRGIK